MNYTQDNRLLAIETPLGKDVLLLNGFSGTEGVSSPFSFDLDLTSQVRDVQFKDIVGKKVTLSVGLANGHVRYFHGLISRFSLLGRDGGETGDPRLSYCTATMVPWLWLLSRATNSRIFQNLSVPDIVEKIFKERELTDYKLLLDSTYEKRHYCVQYRETDLNFVSRLLEEEGIFYFFEHEEKKHTLVLADENGKFKACPNQESARYQLNGRGLLEEDTIASLEVAQEIKAGKYTLNDYNFETPKTDLKIELPTKHKLGPGEREIYDHPGIYTKRPQGDRLTNIRMEEEEARITTHIGTSVCRAFTSGYRFKLLDHYRTEMNEEEYLLTSVSHRARQGGYGSGGSQGQSQHSYRNDFSCIPVSVQYRAARSTPKPLIHSTQTAIVVGPSGEEIYTDKYGRIKVQFHWDREGKRDEKSSCWVRVGQLWAGSGWGSVYIPRIGQEVIVGFLEGDPDRPIVLGCVYHQLTPLPYGLPEESTKSGIRSNSTIGGGGANEILFEDKKGSEEIYIHGEKDWNIVVKNNKRQSVGTDEIHKVKGNMILDVGKEITLVCGSSTIVMKPDVIEIDSPTVKINSGRGAVAASGSES
jgi:type VI secretion system secreted protein VgrG